MVSVVSLPGHEVTVGAHDVMVCTVVVSMVDVRVAGWEAVVAVLEVSTVVRVLDLEGPSVVDVSLVVGAAELVEVFGGVVEELLVLLSSPLIHLHQFRSGGNTGPAPLHAAATHSAEPSMICSRVSEAQPHSKSPGVQSFAA
jgi:hypothetical protein